MSPWMPLILHTAAHLSCTCYTIPSVQLQQRAALGLVKRTGPAVAILNAGKKYALGDSVEASKALLTVTPAWAEGRMTIQCLS